MKTLYLECGMGAAGDMLMAALLELVPDRQAFVDRMNALFAPRIHLEAEPAVKCGITGTHMHVVIDGVEEESEDDHDHEHHHHHDHDDEHGHDHEHHHHHDHDDEHEHEHHHHDHDDEHEHDHEHHHHHDHDDEHEHEHHHHDHDDEHDHDHEHPHHHDHDEHDHDHEHDEHDHGHHHGHHHHSSLQDIHDLINALDIPEKVKEDARAVYGIIADAESQVHGHPVSEIHFHEVGTLDAVVDVVGVCLLMDILSPQQVFASPVHVGSGYVRCMHGVLPVPAPATALILKGIPTYGGKVQGELCTPTGAALLRHFVQHFGDRPVMATASIGYGMGMKDFERANCVRAFLGESEGVREEITRLECNLDDMSGEEIGFAMDQLLKAGARDVYTQAIGMKKSRPGTLLSVICLPEDADRLAGILMQHTTTLGIRRQDMNRYVLSREITTADTPYGPVRIKTSSGMGVKKAKPEYDDLAAIAEKTGLSIREIREQLK